MTRRLLTILSLVALLFSAAAWDIAVAEAPSQEKALEIYASCWGHMYFWELTITAERIGTLAVNRRWSSSLPEKTTLAISKSQVERVRKAMETADFFKLDDLYGRDGPHHPTNYRIRITSGGAAKQVVFVAARWSLHDVPPALLELWCVIRELFDDPEAHNDVPFKRSFLSHGPAVGYWSLETIDGEPIANHGLSGYTLDLSADGTWRSLASITDEWSGPKPLSNGHWSLSLDRLECSVSDKQHRTPYSLKCRESLTVQSDPVLLSRDGTPATTQYVWHPMN